MLRREDAVRYQHMLNAMKAARRFAAGRGRADFDADEVLRFAVVHAVQIVGEAASQLSEGARSLLPAFPWEAAIAMRNRLVYSRFDINPDLVWATVTDDLPPLIAQLEPLIPPDDPTAAA